MKTRRPPHDRTAALLNLRPCSPAIPPAGYADVPEILESAPPRRDRSGHAVGVTRVDAAVGFTLLELLVAVSITLMLAVLLLSVVTSTLRLWQSTQDRFSTASQAKLVFDLVERDLQAAVFRRDDGTWLAIEVATAPSGLAIHGWLGAATMKPAGAASLRLLPDSALGFAATVSQARFGLSGAWLRLITTNVEAAGSLPAAVAYQIARRPVSGGITAGNPAAVRYSLFRSVVSAEYTLAAGNDVVAPAYGSASLNPTASRTAATLTNPNNNDVLATNVVDFGLWLYVRDATGTLRRIFPSDESDLAHAAHEAGAAPDASRFPDAADVMVRILTEKGATLLGEIEGGAGRMVRPADYASDADWWWAIVESNSQVYARRVELKGGAL